MGARVRGGDSVQAHTPRHSAMRMHPDFANDDPLLNVEGAGNAGCAARTHGLVCEMKKHTSKFTTGTSHQPTFPARMVLTVSFVLSPAIGLFVTVTGAMRKHRRQFDASVEASRPHDFAVRVSCVRLAHARVHRIPRPTFVTIAKRPSFRGRDARIDKAVSSCSRSKLFLQRGLDNPNRLGAAYEFGVLAHCCRSCKSRNRYTAAYPYCGRRDGFLIIRR